MTRLFAGTFRRLVWVAAVLGLAVRAWWTAWATRTPTGLFDPARYLGFGDRIADGLGYVEFTGHPTAYYPPGYPYFVGILTWLSRPFTHDPTRIVAAVQVLLGTATVLLVAFVARRLGGRGAGVVAAFAYALYPNLVMHSGVLLGETLNIFLMMSFLAVVVRRPLSEDRSTAELVGIGVLLALALLVRPVSGALLVALILAWWVARRDLGEVLRRTGLVLVGVALCLTPWIVRNAVRMHGFVPMSTNTGDNLCIGYQPDANGAFAFDDHCAIGDPFRGPASEIATDKAKTRYALHQIRRDPGRLPWLLWRRTYFTWFRDGDHDAVSAAQDYYTVAWMAPATNDRLERVADLYYWLVGSVGVAGLALLAWRRRADGLLIVGSFVVTAGLPLLFFGESRFKVPAIPLLIVSGAVAASVAVGSAVSSMRTDRSERREQPVG
ncbi:MAG: glycosyltransferase family 39 protein [Acidimicrobiales bacterium]|nr:glycosyltransferase family 39 protein [Acidimicrobiales bacterium]